MLTGFDLDLVSQRPNDDDPLGDGDARDDAPRPHASSGGTTVT